MQDQIRASQLHLFSADPPVKANILVRFTNISSIQMVLDTINQVNKIRRFLEIFGQHFSILVRITLFVCFVWKAYKTSSAVEIQTKSISKYCQDFQTNGWATTLKSFYGLPCTFLKLYMNALHKHGLWNPCYKLEGFNQPAMEFSSCCLR